jgi:Tfp pilus assembly protein PilV
MKKLFHRFLPANLKSLARGDTVVEVMISMTVLAVVVGAAYAVSTRSFQIGLNSQYRDQAVSFSQQQLEILKEADNNNPSTISTYTASPGTPFCINPSNETIQSVTSGNCLMSSYYTVIDTYDSGAKNFKVVTSWDDAASHTQQSIIFYKTNDSFSGAVVPTCAAASPTCVPLGTGVPQITMSASPSSVHTGSTTTISWTNFNVKASTCHATGPGGFSSVNANTSPGTYTTSALTPAGTKTFSVHCTDNVGNNVAGSTTVTVL